MDIGRDKYEDMASYDVLPGNQIPLVIDSILAPTANRLRQLRTGTDTATKIQNLNTFLYDSTNTIVSATITTTVAQVLVAGIPAYRVHVSGSSNNSQDDTTGLYILGGFPHSPNSAQTVNTDIESTVLPTGIVTVYEDVLLNQGVNPLVFNLTGTALSFHLVPFPYWIVDLTTYNSPAGVLTFDFSFDLTINP